MNIQEISNTIKSLSDMQLKTAYMNGSVPQFLALGEMARRNQLRQGADTNYNGQSIATEMLTGIGSIPPTKQQMLTNLVLNPTEPPGAPGADSQMSPGGTASSGGDAPVAPPKGAGGYTPKGMPGAGGAASGVNSLSPSTMKFARGGMVGRDVGKNIGKGIGAIHLASGGMADDEAIQVFPYDPRPWIPNPTGAGLPMARKPVNPNATDMIIPAYGYMKNIWSAPNAPKRDIWAEPPPDGSEAFPDRAYKWLQNNLPPMFPHWDRSQLPANTPTTPVNQTPIDVSSPPSGNTPDRPTREAMRDTDGDIPAPPVPPASTQVSPNPSSGGITGIRAGARTSTATTSGGASQAQPTSGGLDRIAQIRAALPDRFTQTEEEATKEREAIDKRKGDAFDQSLIAAGAAMMEAGAKGNNFGGALGAGLHAGQASYTKAMDDAAAARQKLLERTLDIAKARASEDTHAASTAAQMYGADQAYRGHVEGARITAGAHLAAASMDRVTPLATVIARSNGRDTPNKEDVTTALNHLYPRYDVGMSGVNARNTANLINALKNNIDYTVAKDMPARINIIRSQAAALGIPLSDAEINGIMTQVGPTTTPRQTTFDVR